MFITICAKSSWAGKAREQKIIYKEDIMNTKERVLQYCKQVKTFQKSSIMCNLNLKSVETLEVLDELEEEGLIKRLPEWHGYYYTGTLEDEEAYKKCVEDCNKGLYEFHDKKTERDMQAIYKKLGIGQYRSASQPESGSTSEEDDDEAYMGIKRLKALKLCIEKGYASMELLKSNYPLLKLVDEGYPDEEIDYLAKHYIDYMRFNKHISYLPDKDGKYTVLTTMEDFKKKFNI